MMRLQQKTTSFNPLFFTIGIQCVLPGLTFLLFLSAKAGLSTDMVPLRILRVLGVHAGLSVSGIAMFSLVFAFLSIRQFTPRLEFSLRHLSFVIVILSLWLTAFPLGNKIKHHTFFFEKWMWYCALWFVFTNLAISISLVLIHKYPFILRYFGTKFQGTHQFLHRSFHTKHDFIFITLLSIFVGTLTGSIDWYRLGGIPHVQDSIAQFFQAKVFAHGSLVRSVPELPQCFERIYVVTDDGQWYSIYPPGHALVLALGVAAGIPFLVNPLTSAALAVVFFLFARNHFSPFVARTGCLLLSLSPFFILMGSGFMNHPTSLLFLMLFLHFLFGVSSHSQSHGTVSRLILAGFFFGMAFLTRPMTALAILSGAVGWTLGRFRRDLRRFTVIALLCLAGTIPPALFYLTYNAHTTGSALLTGYEKYFGGNPMGFGKRPWGAEPLGPRLPNEVLHTPARGLANTLCNLNALNAYLFGWPVPSLLFAFGLFLPGMRRTRFDWWLAGCCALVAFVYSFYFFQDYCYGPRFFYETIPFWILLTARGIEECLIRLENSRLLSAAHWQGFLYGWLTVFFLMAFSTSWIERYNELKADYWGTQKKIAVLLREGIAEENAVLFVEDDYDYVTAFSFLNPMLDRGWIVAHDCGPETNEKLLERYREWPVYTLRLIEDETTGTLHSVLEKGKPSRPEENTAILQPNLRR